MVVLDWPEMSLLWSPLLLGFGVCVIVMPLLPWLVVTDSVPGDIMCGLWLTSTAVLGGGDVIGVPGATGVTGVCVPLGVMSIFDGDISCGLDASAVGMEILRGM